MADKLTSHDVIVNLFKCPIPWAPDYLPDYVVSNIKNIQKILNIKPPVEVRSDQGFWQQIYAYESQCVYNIPRENYIELFNGEKHGMNDNVPFVTLALYLFLTALTPSFYMITNQWMNTIAHQIKEQKTLSRKCFTIIRFVLLPPYLIFFSILFPFNISMGLTILLATFLSLVLLVCLVFGGFVRQMILIGGPLLVAFSSSTPIYAIVFMEISLITYFQFRNASKGMPHYSLERARNIRCLSSNKRDHLLIVCEYKALQMIITSIVILAVDFLTFPRSFCKTVYSGLSVMDLGVGGIIFMSGLVSPYAKGSRKDETALFMRLIRAIRSSGPLGILGLLRFFLLQIFRMKPPVQEYGIHWNFYLTLMLVFVSAEVVCSILRHPYLIGLFGFALGIIYQVIINMFDLTFWMFQGGRDGLFNANREGILGTLGFLCLYLIAVAVGNFLREGVHRSLHPNNERSFSRKLSAQVFCGVLFLSSLGFLGFALTLERILSIPASRRFVNITWVSFMCGLELFAVGVSALIDIALQNRQEIFLIIGANENQLLIFLVANVLTGTTNLIMQTLLQPPLHVIIILLLYTSLISYIGYRMGAVGQRIKLT